MYGHSSRPMGILTFRQNGFVIEIEGSITGYGGHLVLESNIYAVGCALGGSLDIVNSGVLLRLGIHRRTTYTLPMATAQ